MTTKELLNKIRNATWDEFMTLIPKKESFGKKLANTIRIKNSTLNKVSEDTGISDSLLYAVEADKRKLSRDNVLRVGFSLGLSIEEFNELLKAAGYKELYSKNPVDAIIIWGLENNKSRYEVDCLFYETGIDFILSDTKN